MKPKRMFIAALALSLLLLTGCAAEAVSSAPPPSSAEPASSAVPVSSVAPSSAEPVSSTAPAPVLNLSFDAASLQCTIASDCAYVDTDGVLHYYPEFLKTGDIHDSANPTELNPTTLPDGQSGVRSIYRTWGMVYALMKDHTVRGLSQHMRAANTDKIVDGGAPHLETISGWKNIGALYPIPFGGGSASEALLPLALPIDDTGNAVLRLSEFKDGGFVPKNQSEDPMILQICCGDYEVVLCDNGRVYTYSGNTVLNSAISEWTDIVQIAIQTCTLIGLKSDGTLLQAEWNQYADTKVVNTNYPTVPEEYCAGVARIFDSGVSGGKEYEGNALLQLENGTVFYGPTQADLGVFEPLDQIFFANGYAALTQSGKVVRLTEKLIDKADFVDWLTEQKNIATVGRK